MCRSSCSAYPITSAPFMVRTYHKPGDRRVVNVPTAERRHGPMKQDGAMPRRVDHDERRRQIAAALVDIAATRGLHAVTMREVAAQASVSLRLVQYYFSTKQELLTATAGYLAQRLSDRIIARAAAIGQGLPPRTVLAVTLGAVLPTDAEPARRPCERGVL